MPGDLVVGTGDFNFDFTDDFRARPDGGIWDTQHEHATSSYEVLGLDGVEPTREGRWIDYLWIADRTLRVKAKDPGSGQYVEHESLGGFSVRPPAAGGADPVVRPLRLVQRRSGQLSPRTSSSDAENVSQSSREPCLVADHEPVLALGGGAVGPRLLGHLALGLALDVVVADGRRRLEREVDVLLRRSSDAAPRPSASSVVGRVVAHSPA